MENDSPAPRPSSSTLLQSGLYSGIKKGWQGFLWMMNIILPVSIFTTLLAWSGILGHLDFIIQPVMNLFHLPAMAALPLLIGMLTNLYGGIAAMIVLPFDQGQMTLMALFLLMAHNLIQEGIIQGQSGIHPLKITLFRIITASITVMIVAPWLAAAPVTDAIHPLSLPGQQSFSDVIVNWLKATSLVAGKIFVLIMAIMVLLEMAKVLNWITPIVRFFSPLLKIMGLDQKVGLLWMTGVVFGLAYGGAVIVEEVKANHLTQKELELLHLSIGINHSMIEDPLLFMSMGLSAFWLYIPRIIMAIVTVHLIRVWQGFIGRVQPR